MLGKMLFLFLESQEVNLTKIIDIAKEVGMSTRLLFHYFKSKENLYEELIKDALLGLNSIGLSEIKVEKIKIIIFNL